jgi:hypothetical protein
MTGFPIQRPRGLGGLALAATLSFGPAALAQPAEFAGRWVIAGATIAPWADPAGARDLSEVGRLVGQSVSFRARSVSGPEPLGCAGAVYVTRMDGPDMLFEGSLAEPDAAGRPRNARALARGIGMTTPTVRTLETGCSEISYHRLAADELVFGLNDHVYRMRRDPAGAAK